MRAEPSAKRPFDLAAYAQREQDGPCFVCAVLDDHPDYQPTLQRQTRMCTGMSRRCRRL